MPATSQIRLDPQIEERFLETILATLRALAAGSNGKQLAVIGHYQEELETRKAELAKHLERKKPEQQKRRAAV